MLPGLTDRPLTVLRVLRGREPFSQKNVPKYTPDWVRTVPMWAEASHREVRYALCNDWRTLLWLANQRARPSRPAQRVFNRFMVLARDEAEASTVGYTPSFGWRLEGEAPTRAGPDGGCRRSVTPIHPLCYAHDSRNRGVGRRRKRQR